MNRMILTVAIVGLLASALWRPEAKAASANPEVAAVRASIDAGNAKFLKALEMVDGKAYAALFTPDGIELASGGGEPTKGRAALEAEIAEGAKSASKITGGTIHTTNVYLDGARAYETGTYSFKFSTPGKPVQMALGRYFEIWAKQPDGSWLIKVDCGYPDKYKR